jgi:hypothetical protein
MAQDNEIHSLRFTPRKYKMPNFKGKYLITLTGKRITTLSGKNIKTNG